MISSMDRYGRDRPFEAIDWSKMSDDINNMPVNVKSIGFTFPTVLMQNMLGMKKIRIEHERTSIL